MSDTLGQWVVPFTTGRWTALVSVPFAVAAGWGFTWGLEHNLYATAALPYVIIATGMPMFAHHTRVHLTELRLWQAVVARAVALRRAQWAAIDLAGAQ